MAMLLGTCGWSYPDWVGIVYADGAPPRDWLPQYAGAFDLVEADTTFYRTPSPDLVKRWRDVTPAHFAFTLKIPREITHDRKLVDVDGPLGEFLDVTAALGSKRSAVVFQFPRFRRSEFVDVGTFLDRLDRVLRSVPRDVRAAVEIRNREWFGLPFLDLLAGHAAAPVLTAQPWMPGADALIDMNAPLHADFAYIRLLGDREGMERVTTRWDRTVVDRRDDVAGWRRVIRRIADAAPDAPVLVLANNHYGGHAPDTLRLVAGLEPERSASP